MKLSYINLPRIIVLELFGHWTMLIVFLFFVLIVPYGSQSSQITFENFILEFPKNMIKFASLLKRSYKISPVCLSICPSTCDAFFSGSPLQIFFKFFAWHFAIYTKKWQSQILENCISGLDNLGKRDKFGLKSECLPF